MNFGLHKIVDSKPEMPDGVLFALPRCWESVNMEDGSEFYHVSCSYPDKLPSWEDLRSVKDSFIGKDKEAFQVLPKQEDYVNVHPYCLHLWAEK